MKFRTLFLLLGLPLVLTAQTTLTVPAGHFGVDTARQLLLVHRDLAALNAAGSLPEQIDLAGTVYELSLSTDSLHYGTHYPLTRSGAPAGTVTFTGLPLINIRAAEPFSRDERRPATFSLVDGEQFASSPLGIRYRGHQSLSYPKKNLDLEFYEDTTGQETVDFRFGGFREDDDWVMDALANEPLRVNSYVAHQLWLDIHELYYAADEPKANAGARVMYTEVFVNDDYRGVYMLMEQVDRKQLKLKKLKDGEVRGELYKGDDHTRATRFLETRPLSTRRDDNWAGWEVDYPDIEDADAFPRLFDLIEFVANSSDEDFRAGIAARFHLDNVIDYYLYANTIFAIDNHGKNQRLARYSTDEPYFFSVWDLDATFGNNYDGSDMDDFSGWLGHNLYDRLIATNAADFNTSVCDRYRDLAPGLLSADSLGRRIDRALATLADNGALAREAARWPDLTDAGPEQRAYTADFLRQRTDWMNRHVCSRRVSTTDPGRGPAFRVHPNPTGGAVSVEREVTTRAPYRLFSATGRLVATGWLASQTETIDLPRLTPGVYLLIVDRRAERLIIR